MGECIGIVGPTGQRFAGRTVGPLGRYEGCDGALHQGVALAWENHGAFGPPIAADMEQNQGKNTIAPLRKIPAFRTQPPAIVSDALYMASPPTPLPFLWGEGDEAPAPLPQLRGVSNP